MKRASRRSVYCTVFAVSSVLGTAALAQTLPGEGPRLATATITQTEIEHGEVSFNEIREQGLQVFTTPFNKADGYGDGPMDPADTTTPGGRPSLQGNGTFLRVNGLDGQTCLECHFIGSNAKVPARLTIGGVGGSVSNAMFLPTVIDVSDVAENGMALFDGRFINPPFLFGSGGIELLAKEMTIDLQLLKAQAAANPGTEVSLISKGVDFGVLTYQGGNFDTSGVEGVDDDLVVRPFGRKGEFASMREFDLAALMFHFGMQPQEVVGAAEDEDKDGIADEILPGHVSSMAIFTTTLPRPRTDRRTPKIQRGSLLFEEIGCAECHIPRLRTRERLLTYSFPEVPTDPAANVFFQSNLSRKDIGFTRSSDGGLIVPLYADLKRHYVGPALEESFGSPLDAYFTTARLWGVADTAPYLHDGRALTLGEAILLHGGEAEAARERYAGLRFGQQANLLRFLGSLRTPTDEMATDQ